MRNLYSGGCGLSFHNDIMLVAFGSAASLVSAGVRLMINKYLIYGQGFYWFLLTFSEGNEKQPANAPTLRSKLLDHRGGNATNFGKRLSVGNDQDRSPDGEILLVGRLENRRAKPELDSSRTAGSRVSPLFQVHRPRFAIVSSPAKSANQNEMGRGQELKKTTRVRKPDQFDTTNRTGGKKLTIPTGSAFVRWL